MDLGHRAAVASILRGGEGERLTGRSEARVRPLRCGAPGKIFEVLYANLYILCTFMASFV